ncbi:MAG: 30S ribosomal protein S12 methylthiotransferase RimO [Armatimonadota bacterium]
MPEKIALVNLGCPKNLVDAEVMLGHLKARGYELTTDADSADVVVVNTCGFLKDASQESVDAILEAAERKKDGRLRAVVAAGCMTQRYGDGIAEAMPEVDGFLGVGQAHHLPDLVERVLRGERASVLRGPSAGFEGYGLRLQATPSYTTYLKVSEGCDRHCAFCVIPQFRGKMQSRSVDEIVGEARALAARGTRELVLIGQDPTRYGADDGGHRMPELLERLHEIEELRWIRVLYLFPDRHVQPILQAVAALPKVCKYVDMPFQHVSPTVLRRMNRPGGAQEYLRLLENLREACPDVSVRSTFIVGFPGETAADFRELKAFVRSAELDWIGAFRYSPEEGSPAAAMAGQVDRRTSRRRYERLMALQQEIGGRRQQRWLHRDVDVLVEQVEGARAAGRTQGQAPEIDGETHLDLSDLPDVRPGDFVRAVVTEAGPYDLHARAVERLHRSPRPHPGLIQIAL